LTEALPQLQPPPRRVLRGVVNVALLAVAGFSLYLGGRSAVAWYYHRRAEQAIAAGKFEEGLADLERCLQIWTRNGEAHFLAGRTARRNNDYQSAEKHLKKAQELGWNKEQLQLEHALMRAQRENPALVEAYLQACLQKEHPDAVYIFEAQTQGYLATLQLGAAMSVLARWLKQEPDNIRALYWRGNARELAQMEDEAMADYRRVLALDADRDDARHRLADLSLRHKSDYQAAADLFEQVRAHQGDKPDLLLGLARAYRGLRRREDARLLLDQILRENPNDAPTLSERGRLAAEVEQYDEAEDYFRRSIKVDPSDPDTIADFITALREGKKSAEAKEWEKRLERLKADQDRFDQVHREMYERPRDPNLRCEAGEIMLRNGRLKEAQRWFSLALQLDPAHRPTHRALAQLFEQQGNKELARHHRQLAGP
jgi:tetratricopeptide (TPR) repeat protein